jgi:uncharacterized spore protein YtfJ
MENETFVERIANPLQTRASVEHVFGAPVSAEGKTIIPVAQIAFGFGGGLGQGVQKNGQNGSGAGAGGGGGMFARPKGIYEITEKGTRFIPASQTRPLLLAALAGFLLRGWIMRKGH